MYGTLQIQLIAGPARRLIPRLGICVVGLLAERELEQSLSETIFSNVRTNYCKTSLNSLVVRSPA